MQQVVGGAHDGALLAGAADAGQDADADSSGDDITGGLTPPDFESLYSKTTSQPTDTYVHAYPVLDGVENEEEF